MLILFFTGPPCSITQDENISNKTTFYFVQAFAEQKSSGLKLGMKQFLLFFILLFLPIILFAQKGLQKCDSLVTEKQYLSAFECYDKADPENSEPDVVMKKAELALDYNVKSIRNHLFAFVDLRPVEELDTLRKVLKNDSFRFYEFKIDSVLLRLSERYPGNFQLVKTLGDFYYITYREMGDNWFISAKQLLNKFYDLYLKAYENGVYDARSLYGIAFYHSVFENYEEAESWYGRSLALKPDDPLTAYGMGVNCLLNRKPEKGIEPMRTAFQLYSDPLKKGDAARVLGIMYYKTDRKQKALEMFQKADSLSPAYHPNQMFLLRSQLQMGQDKPALELAGVIFDQAPVDPDVPDELLEMFRIEGEGELLATLFSNLLQQYRHNPEANGNIRFHYGKLLYLEGYHKKAVKMFRKSKKQFQKTLPRDHHVFKMLDDMIEKINEQG